MSRRWLAWWTVAEEAAGSLAHPRVDRAAADADVQAVIAHSRLFAATGAVVDAAHRSWIHSRVRGAVERRHSGTADGSLAARIRFAAYCTVVAAATALVLLAAGNGSGRRFQAVLPLAALLVALAVARSAGALARAWLDKNA
jgi:hypothetical protein